MLVAAVVMASCADPPAEPSGGPEPPEPSSIRVSATYDESSCCYTEGFVPVVRIEGSRVDVEEEFEFAGDGFREVVLEVPRGGEYRLESWVEPCAAICATDAPRDPPTDHCSASVSVPDGAELEVEIAIRTLHPCQLSVEGQ